MANAFPYNIIMSPYTVYTAPVGTARPAVNAAPSGSWTVLGTLGTADYTEKGVEVSLAQKVNTVRGAGSTGKRKASRTESDFSVSLEVMDLTLEQIKHALNENPITTVAAASGVPGSKRIGIYQDVDVNTIALLVRGLSPYSGDPNSFAQFFVPIVFNEADVKMVTNKGVAATINFKFSALVDPNAATITDRFGYFEAYTAAALP